MPAFQFDPLKTLEENCREFIDELETGDAELAAILHENWDQLLTVVQRGESSSRNRAEFNAAIGTALDNLILEPTEEEAE